MIIFTISNSAGGMYSLMKTIVSMSFAALILAIFFIVPYPVVYADSSACHGNFKEVIILVPKSTASVPFLILKEKNPLNKNVDIRVDTFINHAKALAMLLRGEIQFLFTGTSQGWENRKSGGPLIMIDTGVWGVSYMIGRDSSLNNFSKLKHKRIALPFPNSPLDFQTRYILIKRGINPDKDIRISYGPFSQTIPRLLKNQLDAAPLPEPLATSMVKQHGLIRLIDYKKAWALVSGGTEASPQVSLFTTDNIASEYPKLIKKLVAAWKNASVYVQKNPSEAAKKSTAILSMPSDIVETAIRNTYYSVPSLGDNRKMVKTYFSQLKNLFGDRIGEPDNDFFFK